MLRPFALAAVLFCSVSSATGFAQDTASAQQPVVPHLVRFTGTLAEAPASASVVQVRFGIYAAQTGGEPLWSEEQFVPLDTTGRYSVLLGTAAALPDAIFADGEARWVGVRLASQPELPRTALTASAYALKASDAETVGGHPATDFVLAAKDGAKPAGTTNISQINAGAGITGGGTGPTVTLGADLNYLVAQGDNVWAQLGAANTFTKSQTVNGNLTVNGTFGGTAVNGLVSEGNSVWAQLNAANTFHAAQTLAATGTATSSQTYGSYPLTFTASTYKASGGVTIPLNMYLQAESAGTNNNSLAKLSLLSDDAGKYTETGFSIAENGLVSFASGQAFPGTLASISASSPLTATTSGSAVTLGLNLTQLEQQIASEVAEVENPNTYLATQTFGAAVVEQDLVTQTAAANGAILNVTNTQATNGGGISGSGALFGIQGVASQNSTASDGVYGLSSYGDGIFGVTTTSGQSGLHGTIGAASSSFSTSKARAAVLADGGASGFTGLFAAADNAGAISSLNNSGTSTLLAQNNGSGPAGYFVSNSTGQYSVIAQNNAAGPAGYFIGSAPSTAILTVKNTDTTNPQNTQVAQFLGDNAGNVGCTVFGNGNFSCSNELIGNGYQAVQGYSTSGDGVYGTSSATYGAGVYGSASAASSSGVIGINTGGLAGVTGRFGSASGTFGSISSYQAGVVADGGSSNHSGLVATADAQSAIYAQNNTTSSGTIYAINTGGGNGLYINQNSGGSKADIHTYSTSDVWAYFDGFDGTCEIVASGEIDCTGNINSNQDFLTGDVKHTVRTTAVQGARSWVEEAGSADLVDGRALVKMPAEFAGIANSDIEYQVFLTPGGDCAGLYVAHKRGNSFEVHELQGGHSSLRFDYRILAERRGKEGQHLVDVTDTVEARRKSEGARSVPVAENASPAE